MGRLNRVGSRAGESLARDPDTDSLFIVVGDHFTELREFIPCRARGPKRIAVMLTRHLARVLARSDNPYDNEAARHAHDLEEMVRALPD